MEVEWADQQKINEFSKLNTRLLEYEDQEITLKQQKEDLDDLEMETELVDEDEKLMYRLGDGFVSLPQGEIMKKIEERKEKVSELLELETSKKTSVLEQMDTLKAALYAKFGRENINLERD